MLGWRRALSVQIYGMGISAARPHNRTCFENNWSRLCLCSRLCSHHPSSHNTAAKSFFEKINHPADYQIAEIGRGLARGTFYDIYHRTLFSLAGGREREREAPFREALETEPFMTPETDYWWCQVAGHRPGHWLPLTRLMSLQASALVQCPGSSSHS